MHLKNCAGKNNGAIIFNTAIQCWWQTGISGCPEEKKAPYSLKGNLAISRGGGAEALSLSINAEDCVPDADPSITPPLRGSRSSQAVRRGCCGGGNAALAVLLGGGVMEAF